MSSARSSSPLSRHDDVGSQAWVFICRGAEYAELPFAFQPYVRYCAWISSPQTRHLFLLRGYIQFNSNRHLSVLKKRYSKQCEWYPYRPYNKEIYNTYAIDVIPVNAHRFIYGTPLYIRSIKVRTESLPHVGYGIEVPDLFEDYIAVLFSQNYSKSSFTQDDEFHDGTLDYLLDYYTTNSKYNI